MHSKFKLVVHTTNSTFLILMELAFDETQYEAGFTNGRLAKQHKFKLADACLCVCGAVCTLLLIAGTSSHLLHTQC